MFEVVNELCAVLRCAQDDSTWQKLRLHQRSKAHTAVAPAVKINASPART